MADTAGDLIEGLLDMRIRNALLVTALRKLDGTLKITQREASESANFDVKVTHGPQEITVSLVPAPV